MFSALDMVDYGSLQAGVQLVRMEHAATRLEPQRLLTQSCRAVVPLITRALHFPRESLPPIPSLMQGLLHAAVEAENAAAVVHTLATWPVETLCVRESLPMGQPGVFDGIQTLLIKGLNNRQAFCRMKCLDLKGISLSQGEVELYVELVDHIAKEWLPSGKLHVKINDLVIYEWLSRVTNVEVEADRVFYVKRTHFHMQWQDSVSQDEVVVEQPQENANRILINDGIDCLNIKKVHGLTVRNLGIDPFCTVANTIGTFNNLKALELVSCHGVTQERAGGRDCYMLCRTLSSMPQLTRLGLRSLALQGCVMKVLQAVVGHLQFLSLEGCSVFWSESHSLARSKHAASLLELNTSGLVYSDNERWRSVVMGPVLETLSSFISMSGLVILNLSLWTPEEHSSLCNSLRRNLLPALKVLILSNTEVTESDHITGYRQQVEVGDACSRLLGFQRLCFRLCVLLHDQHTAQALADHITRHLLSRRRDILVLAEWMDLSGDLSMEGVPL